MVTGLKEGSIYASFNGLAGLVSRTPSKNGFLLESKNSTVLRPSYSTIQYATAFIRHTNNKSPPLYALSHVRGTEVLSAS